MQNIKIYAAAAVIAIAGLVGTGLTTQVAKADTSWQPEVIISSAQVRFEAQVAGYDSTTNKYKYKFSWLMPKGKTYSFLIDGNMYQSKVIQNGVVETPFWFSPDITYKIQVYGAASGKGGLVGEGVFKAPTTKPVLTRDQELDLLAEYILSEGELPRTTVKSAEDAQQIAELGLLTRDLQTFEEMKPYLSSRSIELFSQIPILSSELDGSATNKDITKYTAKNVKIYKGKQYGSMKIMLQDVQTKEKDSFKAVFVKENNAWKIDMIQTIVEMFKAEGLL